MKYYIIAGEASGDLHGSNLIKALQKIDNQAVIRAWGGDMMAGAGADIRKHYRDLAFMGFLEVVKNLPTIFRNLDFCKRDILAFKPDVVIFIDYPGFNLRIAKWLYTYQNPTRWNAGIGVRTKDDFRTKLFYYISPQIWAWHTSRVHQIKKIMDKVFCILPFEKDFYKKYNYDVDFIGHPLLDVVKSELKIKNSKLDAQNSFDTEGSSLELKIKNSKLDAQNSFDTEGSSLELKIKNSELDAQKYKPIIALLAGSRRQEIEAMLPTMLAVTRFFPDYQFVVAAASAQDLSYYDQFLKDVRIDVRETSKVSLTFPNVTIVQNQTYEVLKMATAALVKSGTSTLETALFGVPQVVCYKGSAVSFAIAKRVVKIKFISLVNLIMDREIVKELIQDDFTVENLRIELAKAIDNQAVIKENYNLLRGALGNEGASDRAAALMIQYLKED
jgi:lipid-A-disaccharide synthase